MGLRVCLLPPAFVFPASLRRDGELDGTVALASHRLLLRVLVETCSEFKLRSS